MSSFSEIINSSQPVLVDFFAEWCGPCKVLVPVLKEIASELNGKARILKVDIDKNPATAEKYGIQAVPTLVIFKSGEIKWRQAGALPKYQIIEIISKFI